MNREIDDRDVFLLGYEIIHLILNFVFLKKGLRFKMSGNQIHTEVIAFGIRFTFAYEEGIRYENVDSCRGLWYGTFCLMTVRFSVHVFENDDSLLN